MKIAILIHDALPNGLKANTAAVLGISLGTKFPEIVRESAYDAEGVEYSGITCLNIPVLSASQDTLKAIASLAEQDETLTLIPFTEVAQRNREYDAYKHDLKQLRTEQVVYSGLALIGSQKKVSRLTGSLPLFS